MQNISVSLCGSEARILTVEIGEALENADGFCRRSRKFRHSWKGKRMKKIGILLAATVGILPPRLQAQPTLMPAQEIAPQMASGDWSAASNWPAMLQAIEALPTIAPEAAAAGGTFWSAQNPSFPPLPADVINVPLWSVGNATDGVHGVYFMQDLNYQYGVAAPATGRLRKVTRQSMPGMPGGSPTSIYINGFSFESPVTNSYSVDVIDGWTVGGPGAGGVVYPGTNYAWIAPATDGVQTGWINGTSPATTVAQTLTNTLQPVTTYTLSLDVTGPSSATGSYPGSNYSVGLYAGGNLLAAGSRPWRR
jgi:hypothetical protein